MVLLCVCLVLIFPNLVRSMSCDCLANPKCAKLREDRSEKPEINCSRLTQFERIQRSQEICKYSSYHCALDIDLVNTYGELCTKTSTIHPGYRPSKELGLFQRPCRHDRYQPFPISSNLTFQCIYEKSKCKEIGQILDHYGSTQTDNACACDKGKNYVFVEQPERGTFCTPSKEDCTCYKKCSHTYKLNNEERCVRKSNGNIQSLQTFSTLLLQHVQNKNYDDYRYNKEFKINFRKRAMIYIGCIVAAYLVINLFLIFLCPVCFYAQHRSVIVFEDRDAILEWTIFDIFKIKNFKIMKKTDTTEEEIKHKTEFLSGILASKVILNIDYTHKADEGEYVLSMTNTVGFTTRRSIVLTINSHPTVIDEWRSKDSQFVETRSFDRVKQMLKDNKCVVIVGHSGSGKSSIMRHIALKMKDEEEYVIYPLFHPEEIQKHFAKSKKQVFLFDDVFGKFAINLHIVDDWIFSMHEIKDILSNDNVKIIMTCRTHIATNEHFKKVKWLTSKSCDINEECLSHSSSERKNIAINHKCAAKINDIVENEVNQKENLFPLLCEMKETFDRIEKEIKTVTFSGKIEKSFFTQPLQKTLETILSQIKDQDRELYAFLALFVISNNVIEERMFPTKEFKAICGVIRNKCKIENVTIDDMRNYFIEFQRKHFFTKVSGKKYKIFHDKVFDIVVEYYGKDDDMFDIILEFAQSDIIRERFYFETVARRDIGHLIPVSEHKETNYFERLFIDTNKEILNNEITFTAFGNRQLQDNKYREKFINFCKGKDQLKKQIKLLSFKVTSPLIEVAAQGYPDILEMLVIEMELNVNVCDEKGDTPLHKASALGRKECVELLLSNGGNCELLNLSGETAFFKAVQGGHLEIANILFDKSKYEEVICTECGSKSTSLEIVNHLNNVGESPLYVAAREGLYDMVDFLIRSGAKLGKCHEYKGSPLHAAAKEGNTAIVKLLLDKGADKDLSTNHIESPLYLASRDGKKEVVMELIERGANVNKCGMDGRSPLCKAAWNGHEDAVRLLLENKADPNEKSKYMESPLYKAARVGHLEIVKMLLVNKAKVDDKCLDGRTPLYKAAWQNKTEVVKFLLEKGADINLFSEYFGTPLYRASKEGHIDTVEILLQHIQKLKTDINLQPNDENKDAINLQSKDGETALHGAAKFGHMKILELLLNNGAKVDIKSKHNLTPLEEAEKMGHKDAFKLLSDRLNGIRGNSNFLQIADD